MRLVAMCVAGLLLMQLPAAASIISSTSPESADASPWNVLYSYWNWGDAPSLLQLAGSEASPEQTFERMLANLGNDGVELRLHSDSPLVTTAKYDVALIAGFSAGYGLETLDAAKFADEQAYAQNIHAAAGSVCPEPATLTIWGISALALAAATYRRQKRGGRNSQHVQAAVKEYLDACDSPSQHFRMLGSYLTRLADDPTWTKQDVEAFYDEVVVALHRRREHAEVA